MVSFELDATQNCLRPRRPEGIPAEGDHDLAQRLVWNLPSLPALGSTGLVDFPESSMPKILKGINSQILLLSQAVACVAELHERELLQATAALRAENECLRELGRVPGDMEFALATPLNLHSNEGDRSVRNHFAQTTPLNLHSNEGMHPSIVVAQHGLLDDSEIQSQRPSKSSKVSRVDFDFNAAGQRESTNSRCREDGLSDERTEASLHSPSDHSPRKHGEYVSHMQNMWPIWSDDTDSAQRQSHRSDDVALTSLRSDLCEVKEELGRTRVSVLTNGTSATPLKFSNQARQNNKRWWVAHPHSLWVIAWDMLGGFFILYDVITVPLSAFTIKPMEDFFDAMLWTCVFYWTADIIMNFIVGFEDRGVVRLDVKGIFHRYLTTWFMPDLIVVSVDWTCIVLLARSRSTTLRLTRLSKVVKALRLLRMVRLVRVIKIPRAMAHVSDTVASAYGLAATRFFILILVYCGLIHATGCYFYFITDRALFPIASSSTWVEANNYQNKEFGFLYLTAAQWAVAQSGFTTTALYPVNNVERAYCVFTGLVWFQVMCIMVVQHLSFLNMINYHYREQWKQEQDIRVYLQKHGSSVAMTNAICRFVRVNFAHRKKFKQEKDIPIMAELPARMRIKMHYQVYVPVLKKHSAFQFFASPYAHEMISVCHVCMCEQHGGPGQTLFRADEEAPDFLFCRQGVCLYYHQHAQRPLSPEVGDFICEPAMWTRWRHKGHLVASTSVELVALNVLRYQVVMADVAANNKSLDPMRKYAMIFVQMMDDLGIDSDLWPPKEIVEQITQEASLGSSWEGMRRQFPNTIMSSVQVFTFDRLNSP